MKKGGRLSLEGGQEIQNKLSHRPFAKKKRQGRRKTPRCVKSKKKSNASKKQEVQPVDLLEQEPLVPITLQEFFPVRFFEKITVNMTSCYELEN